MDLSLECESMGKGNLTLNQQLTISFPEGFRVMDEAERSKLNVLGKGPGECITDPERHVVMSFGWKAVGLAALLLSAKDAAGKAESDICKAMSGYGYHLGGFLSREVGGEKAEGFAFDYEAQGIRMYAESFVVKYKKVLYFLHFYTRRELKNTRRILVTTTIKMVMKHSSQL